MAEPGGVKRVVIADAGPLIALTRVGSLALLHRLFGEVDTTEPIRCAVLASGDFPEQTAVAQAMAAGWLRSHEVDLSDWRPRRPGVAEGEASALTLAQSCASALSIMDDKAGRAEANARGLAVMGVAAVVGLAKARGLVPQAFPILAAMRKNGYFIGDEVVCAVLRRVGEATE